MLVFCVMSALHGLRPCFGIGFAYEYHFAFSSLAIHNLSAGVAFTFCQSFGSASHS